MNVNIRRSATGVASSDQFSILGADNRTATSTTMNSFAWIIFYITSVQLTKSIVGTTPDLDKLTFVALVSHVHRQINQEKSFH